MKTVPNQQPSSSSRLSPARVAPWPLARRRNSTKAATKTVDEVADKGPDKGGGPGAGIRKNRPRVPLGLILAGALAVGSACAQTYVTPKLGGGQLAADMVHIDIYYDAEANQLHAHVDDSYGIPQLQPLESGAAFDPQATFAVLNGKAYNAQYGWNAGGFFTIPAGAAIWIEPLECSPELEVYEGWGKTGSYTPIFGTAGSPRLWSWSGVMVHNTYAVLDPLTDRFFAEYRIYFGDAITGSREGFLDLDDAVVRLEWTAAPVADPSTLRFGAEDAAAWAPLRFVNATNFVTESEHVWNLEPGSVDAFEGTLSMAAVPATAENGGPAPNHAALGTCLEVQLVSLAGPPSGHLRVWAGNETTPRCSVEVGERNGIQRFPVSQNQGTPGTDPYGRLDGWQWSVDQPGLYTVGFRLVDGSTNGTAGGPIHAASEVYQLYLQAGITLARAEWRDQAFTATFGGRSGRTYSLEESLVLGPMAEWQTVSGPIAGTNRLQRLTAPATSTTHGFFRLRENP